MPSCPGILVTTPTPTDYYVFFRPSKFVTIKLLHPRVLQFAVMALSSILQLQCVLVLIFVLDSSFAKGAY